MSQIDSVNPVTPVRASPETAPQVQFAERPRAPQVQEGQPSPETGGQAGKPARPEFALDMMPDVTLRYKIDKDTGALSLLIIDRQSHKIIRAVPPEELARLGLNNTFDDLA